jgi:hypothetical protein
MTLVTDLLDLGSGQTQRTQVPEDQVVVSSVGLELVFVTRQDLGDSSRVGNDLLGVSLESGVSGLLEGDSNTSNGLRTSESSVSDEQATENTMIRLTLLWGPP